MGLESVELLVEVEDTFNLSIASEEAAQVVTVGDLHALVLRKVKAVAKAPCLTAHVFYRLRKAFLEVYDVPRAELALPLNRVVPPSSRRAHWEGLEAIVHLTLPVLWRPRGLTLVLNGLFVLSILGIVAGGVMGGLMVWESAVFLGAAGGLLALAYRLTRPLAVHLPRVQTLGDFVRELFRLNTAELAAMRQEWSAHQVWEVLCGLIIEQTGIEPDLLKPEARFVDDLGFD